MKPNTGGESGTARECPGQAAQPAEPFSLPCIRCGVCCTVYQVRITPWEAVAIAERMGMERWDWVGRYCDPRWHDTRSHLIRHDEHGCVFLDGSSDGARLCRIYDVRPAACRDWAAGVFKPACQEGLKERWRLSVDGEGQLRGDAESLSRLREFLRSL